MGKDVGSRIGLFMHKFNDLSLLFDGGSACLWKHIIKVGIFVKINVQQDIGIIQIPALAWASIPAVSLPEIIFRLYLYRY